MTAREKEKPDAVRALKRAIRARAEACRQRQENKEQLSRKICEATMRLPEYRAAQTVLVYVGRPSEVQTDRLLTAAWNEGKRVVVPCCRNGELELFRVESTEELAPRTLGILEPRPEVRQAAARRVDVPELDLVVAPGVAFDRRGGRLGHGKGYYDRMLGRARGETPGIGLAFECQLFPEVPMTENDVFMHKVVTEDAVYARNE